MSDHHVHRLDGWKAIADFLTRDERTVQRWAKERGLPVHRVPGGKGASVFAYRAELDVWLAGDHQSVTVPAAAFPVHPSATVAIPEGPHASSKTKQLPIRRLALLAGISAAIAIAITATVLVLWPAKVPDTVDLAGNEVVAQAEGQIVWRTMLPRPESAPPDAKWRASALVPVQLIDLDEDQVPEVLALLSLLRADGRFIRAEIFCLSANGEVLWSYTPEASLRFGETTYDGLWRMEGWIVSQGPGGRHVWLSVNHEPWWPSFLVSIDPSGQAAVRFVHPGHFYALTTVSTEEGSFVLAAGVNNDYASAMLAVLNESGAPAVPPASDPRFVCESCPKGSPSRYMLFPRSELNALLGLPYNGVYEAEPTSTGLQISVQEATDPHLRAVYNLTRDLNPDSVGLSDTYWETHRRLEREGRLEHSADECPMRRDGVRVRIWEPEQGWWEETVKVIGR